MPDVPLFIGSVPAFTADNLPMFGTASTCCAYQLWTCPVSGSTATSLWVLAADWAPGDYVSWEGTIYRIPGDAVASLCKGTVVDPEEATEEDCEGEGGEDLPCDDCTVDGSICAYNVILAGFSPGSYNGPVGVSNDDVVVGNCGGFSTIGAGVPLEFGFTCVSGLWVLGLNDAVLGDPDPTIGSVVLGPGTPVFGSPPPGTYPITFAGGALDGQTGTVTVVAIPAGDPQCL